MEPNERMRAIRTYTGLSQRNLAITYGIPTRTIEQWESGERKPPAYVLDLLERAVKQDFQTKRRIDHD